MTTLSYNALRHQQKETLAALKPANTELKRMQAFKKSQLDAGIPIDLDAWKVEFRAKKDYQLSIVHKLADINGELKVARAKIEKSMPKTKEAKVKKSTSTGNAVKDAVKLAKAQARQAEKDAKAASQLEVKAKREAEKAVAKALREAAKKSERKAKKTAAGENADDEDEDDMPVRGYRFPLLTDAQRNGTKILNSIFAGKRASS